MRKRTVEQPTDGSGLICTQCKFPKPHDAFYRAKLTSRAGKAYGGFGMPCKKCIRENRAAPEVKERTAISRSRPEYVAMMQDARRRSDEKHESRIAAYRSSEQAKTLARKRNCRHYANNKTELAVRERTIYAPIRKRASLKYRATDKGRDTSRLVSHRRRARARNNGGNLTRREWHAILAAHDNCCIYCTRTPKLLSIDHVKPIAAGGRHDARNVVPACMRCNRKKSALPLVEALAKLEVDPLDFVFRRNVALLKLRSAA